MVGLVIFAIAFLFALAAAGILEAIGDARLARAIGLDDSGFDR